MKFPLISVRLAGLATAFGLCAALVPGAASAAGSANSNVTVTATVAQNCTISTTTNIAFGAYDPVSVSAVTDATGAVKLTCTKAATGITLTLNAGGGTPVGPDTRAMTGAVNGNFLSYDIYETGAYSTRFPVTPVSETVSGGITTPTTVSLFGQIKAAPQDVSVDTYSDTVQATVNF
jgi:spore coat protein U-like protein